MSELRDYLESVELTERQKHIYDLVCEIDTNFEMFKAIHHEVIYTLKHLLVEEFTGVRIV